MTGDLKNAYSEIKKLVGKGVAREKGDGKTEAERQEFVQDLNKFYSRFDCHDFSRERTEKCRNLEQKAFMSMAPEITESEVEMVFRKVNVDKACGPDQR